MVKVNGRFENKLIRLRLEAADQSGYMDVFCLRWSSTTEGILCYYSNHNREIFSSKDWRLTEVHEY